MRCSMLRLRAAGVSLTGENTGTMNAGGIHARFIAAFSFHALRHSGGGPVSGDHPVSGRLRSERHGRTTVAGPTRKLWFQDRRWPESCQGGPGKRTAFRCAGTFCLLSPSSPVHPALWSSSSGGSIFFRKALRRRKTRALPLRRRSAGGHRSFQNVYKAEPFTLYRTHEKVGKP